MLYDKRWDKTEVKADPFSLESLIAWLEKQPRNKIYNFMNCSGKCLLDQYATAKGLKYPGLYLELDAAFDTEPFEIARSQPWTFGAALTRARAALASPGRGGDAT